ncbi:MAG: glycoside hydrolase family 2 protein, partial [Lachnospiraceae bacterium]
DLVRAISKGVPGKKTALEVYLEVGAAAMTADVSLNGHPIDHHEGGFSLFRAELTPYLEENNLLRIAVDNGANDHVYPQKADFTFYGGLYRGVRLLVFAGQEDSKNDETVMCPHFQPGDHGTDGFSAQALVQKDQSAKVAFEGITAGEADAVRVRVDGDGAHGKWKYLTLLPENDNKVCREIQNSAEKDPARKTWKGEMRIAKPHLWDGIPDPYLYKVTAQVLHGEAVTDEVQETIGIRSFSVDPKRGFFLNGRSYPLIGVARHQDRRGVGNAVSHAQMEEDMDLIRGMGANMIRLAHYQHDPYFYDLCDRYGMIVWAEIPYITEHKDNPRACQNTAEQMTELILQNRQHPSIICWALSNEITVTGGPTPAIYENHKRLNDLCHRLDPSRLTAMAHAFLLDPDDPLVSLPDVSAYNLYYGWYLGTLQDNDAFFDAYHAKHPDRAIGLSEFGADALISYQTSTPKRGDDSEQYQCLYHEHMLKMWSERPYLWMMSVWNMFDFGADGRSDAGEPGVNHKGLVTFDRKTC